MEYEMDTASTGAQWPTDESSSKFSIPGKISYHDVYPDYSMHVPKQPNTGQHWQEVLFCRPARPNMVDPIRRGVRRKVIDHLGNLVAGFRWHSLQFGTGTSWYGWVLLDELPLSFWQEGVGAGVIDDHFVKESNALCAFYAQQSQKRGGSRVGRGCEIHLQTPMEIDQNEPGRTSIIRSDEAPMEVERDTMDTLMGHFQIMALGNDQ